MPKQAREDKHHAFTKHHIKIKLTQCLCRCDKLYCFDTVEGDPFVRTIWLVGPEVTGSPARGEIIVTATLEPFLALVGSIG